MIFSLRKLADNYMQIWNADSEGLLDIYADPEIVIEYTHLNKIEGVENYKKFLQTIYHSFPDLKVNVVEVVPNKKDQSAVVFWNYTGTHKKDIIFGVQPSGKQIAINGISFLKFKNRKIIHEKGMLDNLSLLMQLNPGK